MTPDMVRDMYRDILDGTNEEGGNGYYEDTKTVEMKKTGKKLLARQTRGVRGLCRGSPAVERNSVFCGGCGKSGACRCKTAVNAFACLYFYARYSKHVPGSPCVAI
jgi:hypothetical protein